MPDSDSALNTKVYSDDALGFFWNAGDLISLFGSTTNEQYRFTGQTGDNAGIFIKNDATSLSLKHAFSRYYAIYPYSSNNSPITEGIFRCELDSTQTYRKNSIPEGGFLMVAATDDINDNKVKFKNAYGYLKLQVYGDSDSKIKRVIIRGNNNEVLNGIATVTISSEGIPSMDIVAEGSKTITLDCGSGVQFGTATSPSVLYFALPPTHFTKGFNVEIINQDDESYHKNTLKDIEVKRNTLLTMSSFGVFQGKPIIGIGKSTSGQVTAIKKCIEDAGGITYDIPEYVTTTSVADNYVSTIDGLIIPGSGPNDPSIRNNSDIKLIRASKNKGIPILGICHGHQMINVAFGGTIDRITSLYPNAELHKYVKDGKNIWVYEKHHSVDFDPASRLYEIFKNNSSLFVNTSHTYCVDSTRIGTGLIITARSHNDRIVEGLESTDGMAIGVQFHPEVMYYNMYDTLSLNIFRDLVYKAQNVKSK